jgi:hyperosmotically inducible protein
LKDQTLEGVVMVKILLLTVFSLILIACNRNDRPNTLSQTELDSDNTGINIRDRDSMAKTPFDQSESEADRTITQKIRQALMADNSLSTNAKNIKIITNDGVVTLRGPVANARENDAILRKINAIRGIERVDNQLETAGSNH